MSSRTAAELGDRVRLARLRALADRAGRSPTGLSGGQPGHEARTLRQVAEPGERVVHSPAGLRRLRGVAGAGAGDLHRGPPGVRPARDHATGGRAPAGAPPLRLRADHDGRGAGRGRRADQCGPGLRGVATYLLAAQHLPLARCAELLADLLGAAVSGGRLNAERRASRRPSRRSCSVRRGADSPHSWVPSWRSRRPRPRRNTEGRGPKLDLAPGIPSRHGQHRPCTTRDNGAHCDSRRQLARLVQMSLRDLPLTFRIKCQVRALS